MVATDRVPDLDSSVLFSPWLVRWYHAIPLLPECSCEDLAALLNVDRTTLYRARLPLFVPVCGFGIIAGLITGRSLSCCSLPEISPSTRISSLRRASAELLRL